LPGSLRRNPLVIIRLLPDGAAQSVTLPLGQVNQAYAITDRGTD
jgi:hypothetical protein